MKKIKRKQHKGKENRRAEFEKQHEIVLSYNTKII